MSKKLTAEEAISEAVRWCVDGGIAPSVAIVEGRLGLLSSRALRDMALRGWVSEVNNRIHSGRRVPSSASRRAYSHPLDGRNPKAASQTRAFKLFETPFCAADGSLKALGEFTLPDVSAFRERAAAMRRGWAGREGWAERAEEFLKGAGPGARLSELPDEQIRALKREWGAW